MSSYFFHFHVSLPVRCDTCKFISFQPKPIQACTKNFQHTVSSFSGQQERRYNHQTTGYHGKHGVALTCHNNCPWKHKQNMQLYPLHLVFFLVICSLLLLLRLSTPIVSNRKQKLLSKSNVGMWRGGYLVKFDKHHMILHSFRCFRKVPLVLLWSHRNERHGISMSLSQLT